MKVVLFCGGMGMRSRDYSDRIPTPLVEVGQPPILWHLMKYYAHYGHRDFIFCLGHGASKIKQFFVDYDDLVLRGEISDHLRPSEHLVVEPFQRLIDERQLLAYLVRRGLAQHGHLQGIVELDDIVTRGEPPW